MLQKIIAFFMAIFAFFANLFGLNTAKSIAFKDIKYGDAERQVLDLYIPKNSENEIGLVLYIHGGAWIAGSKEDANSELKNVAEKMGFAAAAISYRYLSETVSLNDIADDIDAALAKIKKIGGDNGKNISKVLLTGVSAGAHLSMLYAYSRVETAPIKPVAVVSYCGPTNLADRNFYYNNNMGDTDFICLLMSYACGQSFTMDTIDDAAAALEKVSPLTYINENTVPTLFAHGQADRTVPFSNAQALDAKLTAYGVQHDFVIYPNSDHDLSSDPEQSKIVNELTYNYAMQYLGN